MQVELFSISGARIASSRVRADAACLEFCVCKALSAVHIPTETQFRVVGLEERCSATGRWSRVHAASCPAEFEGGHVVRGDCRLTVAFLQTVGIRCDVCQSSCEQTRAGQQVFLCPHGHVGFSRHPGRDDTLVWKELDWVITNGDAWTDMIEEEVATWRSEWLANDKRIGYSLLINDVLCAMRDMRAIWRQSASPSRRNAILAWKRMHCALRGRSA